MITLRTAPVQHNGGPLKYDCGVEITGPDTNGVYGHLDMFIKKYMRGWDGKVGNCDKLYFCKKFRLMPSKVVEELGRGGRLNGESNLGKWTMRFCDFMVDHLGQWDLVVCVQ